MRGHFTRRNFLRALGGGAVAGAGAGAYARWMEADWLQVTHTKVPVPRAAQVAGAVPLRVLHLSDLHAHDRWVPLPQIARAVELGLAQKPDVICLTGDYITTTYERFAEYADVLRPLAKAAPTYACLGNHDGGFWALDKQGQTYAKKVREFLQAAGAELVHNTVRETVVRGRRVQIFGVGDWWARECRPDEAFAGATARGDAVRLVLNHNPDAKAGFLPHDWDLMLCGHTHGGQLGIPFLGRMIAPVQDKRFVAGLCPWEGRQIFVTRGVGNLHRMRFLCRPEVSVLEVG